MEYQALRIRKTTWAMLRKVKALLTLKEDKDESFIETINRLVEAELKRLEAKK